MVVARDFALAVTTFDYRDAQGSVDRVLAYGDEGFESEFRAAMGDDFLANLEAAQSVSTGRIVSGPTVQSSSGEAASFLVVVDQTISSPGAATGNAPPSTDPTLGATTTTTATAAPPQVLHLGLLVTVDTERLKVTAVEVL